MTARRPDSPSWTKAKERGDAAELAVAEYFKRLDCEVAKTLGLDAYDLLVLMRLEVKHDLRAMDTGNVAIEVACDGKPSGIRATDADRWIIVVGDTGYMVRPVQLLALLDSKNFKAVPAGDGKRATVQLVPLNVLETIKGYHRLDLSSYL